MAQGSHKNKPKRDRENFEQISFNDSKLLSRSNSFEWCKEQHCDSINEPCNCWAQDKQRTFRSNLNNYPMCFMSTVVRNKRRRLDNMTIEQENWPNKEVRILEVRKFP